MHTNGFHRRAWWTALIAVAALLAATPALAAEPAGRVLVTTGTVTATDRDGFERPLSRNDVVYPGETLATGPSGRIQVRFRDDALVDLQASTEFEIERYRAASEQEGGSAVMNLLKGAMRTITGAIGKGADDEYAVDTPVATIGIRGTDYSLEFCDAACAGNGRAPGLYGRVDDGSITARTGAGANSFATGDYFFVPRGGVPQRIIAPPEGILVDEDDEESQGEEVSEHEAEGVTIIEGDGEGDQGPGDDPLAANDPGSDVAGPNFEAGEEGLPPNLHGAVVAGAFSGLESGGDLRHGAGMFDTVDDNVAAWVDSEGNLFQVTAGDASFHSASAERTDGGTIERRNFSVEWGRWDGEFFIDGDTEVTGTMVYAYTDDYTADDFLASGTPDQYYSFSGDADSVHITDSNWQLEQFTLRADFSDPAITLQMLRFAEIEGNNVTEFSSGSFQLNGTEFSGDVTGFWGQREQLTSPATGTLEGIFVGRNADGALVTFEINQWLQEIDGELTDSIDGFVILDNHPG